ncbi:5214_t:CDS:2 [Gigaspora margarita]|uniref:5214_t:CDS:1 n=1 Tax=Gigaspora margarita TaxID=4874 RepID=A0ABN7V2E4_GIGMA|nr:5214_t:CDS:2 [Gigaspora margarita]
MVLEKVKAYSGDKQNERADQIAKEGDEANVPIRVKRVITKKQSEHSTKKLMIKSTRKLYQDVQYRKCKEEKESFKHLSICLHDKEACTKKEEVLNKWSRGFLADNIELALERMNLFKNKAQDIAVSFSINAEKARNQRKEEKETKVRKKEEKE